jgi:hypothetical protein
LCVAGSRLGEQRSGDDKKGDDRYARHFSLPVVVFACRILSSSLMRVAVRFFSAWTGEITIREHILLFCVVSGSDRQKAWRPWRDRDRHDCSRRCCESCNGR